MKDNLTKSTGKLFGPLWKDLSDIQYQDSVELFNKRAKANNFDLEWLKGKKCLDAGCGSGRYSVALAIHGAKNIEAIDISEIGLVEARKRAKEFSQINFQQASVLNIPFEDKTFDLVWCAGVIHHTINFEKGISEVSRVVKDNGGKLFLLLYGQGGMRWELIKSLRPLVRDLGNNFIEDAIKETDLPANNRKHFMDDLLVPIQKLTNMSELEELLIHNKFKKITRWSGETFDQESNISSQLQDMEKVYKISKACSSIAKSKKELVLCKVFKDITKSYCQTCKEVINDQSIEEKTKKKIIIGDGLLRVIAEK